MRSADRAVLGVSALLGPALGDLLEEADGEEMAEPVDAGVVGRVAVLLVEAAELSVLVAAELVVPAFVARIVDRRGHARRPLGREQQVVVGGAGRAFVPLSLPDASP